MYKYKVGIMTMKDVPIEFPADTMEEIRDSIKGFEINQYKFIRIIDNKTGKIQTIKFGEEIK